MSWTPPSVVGDDNTEIGHLYDLLASLVQPWFDKAECAGLGDLFFPTRDEDVSARMAKQVCAGCPVLAECREYALTLPYQYPGVYGGMSQKERQEAKSARRRRAA